MGIHRVSRFRSSRRGFAYVTTLAYFIALAGVISVVLRDNVLRRSWSRTHEDAVRATYLAESGVAEAMHAIATQSRTDTVDGTIGLGRFSATWAPVRDAPGVVEIVSVGTMESYTPTPVRKTLCVRVRVPPTARDGLMQPTTLSWEMR